MCPRVSPIYHLRLITQIFRGNYTGLINYYNFKIPGHQLGKVDAKVCRVPEGLPITAGGSFTFGMKKHYIY